MKYSKCLTTYLGMKMSGIKTIFLIFTHKNCAKNDIRPEHSLIILSITNMNGKKITQEEKGCFSRNVYEYLLPLKCFRKKLVELKETCLLWVSKMIRCF